MNSADELLEYLDPDQRQVATYTRGPLCVRAGAGTGKTRAITYRIAYAVATGVVQPSNVLAVTFTSRAAGEMRSRLRDLNVHGVSVHTFHAAALRQLSYFWGTAVGGRIPPITPSKYALVSQAAGKLGLPTDKVSIRDLTAEIEWAKVSLIAPEDYAERAVAAGRGEVAGQPPEEIARLAKSYEEVKIDRHTIDFEDVLALTVGMLLDRPDIAREIRAQYRYFVVDEYQDVSPLQHRLLQLWLGERKELCVVGDVSQTIYSFTGASSSYLAHFTSEFKGAKVVELNRDYRSTPQIVAAANNVIEDDRSEGAVELHSQVASGRPIEYRAYPSDEDEASGIVGEILTLKSEGMALSDIAILYRTNAQSAQFEAALSQAGISYSVHGSERFFARREVREAMASFHAAARGEGTGGLVTQVRSVLRQMGWRDEAPDHAGAARERWEALSALLELATHMQEARKASLSEFVGELEERAQMQNAPAVNGVTLCSLHAAKGLEWEAVFLAGMSEGLMPISLAKDAAAKAEERRLLYVGITRARDRLQISYATGNGNRANRKLSRFLTGIWPRPEKEESRTTSYRRRRKEAAAAFESEHAEDIPLFEALQAWRLDKARVLQRAPYTIFHDTTLRAIAVAKPASIQRLGRVRGIGSAKLQAFGEEVLAIVAQYTRG